MHENEAIRLIRHIRTLLVVIACCAVIGVTCLLFPELHLWFLAHRGGILRGIGVTVLIVAVPALLLAVLHLLERSDRARLGSKADGDVEPQ